MSEYLHVVPEVANLRQQRYIDTPVKLADDYIAQTRAALHEGDALPRYASWTWRALPTEDPRWLAAVLVAAEAWRRHNTTEAVAQRLAAELAAENRRCLTRWEDAANDVRGLARMSNEPARTGPTHAEHVERRGRVSSGEFATRDGRDWPRDENGEVL